jgi:uncharacterized coiled-coil protein SlyX
MSEERLEQIENQLSQIVQLVTKIQQDIVVNQNRIERIESTLAGVILNPDLGKTKLRAENNSKENLRLNQKIKELESRINFS